MNKIPTNVGSQNGVLEDIMEERKLLERQVVLKDGEVGEIVDRRG